MRDERDQARVIAALRAGKDDFFRFQAESPLPHELRDGFGGLLYMPFDGAFVVRAELIRAEAPEPVVLATSKGVPREMVRQGHFDFVVANTPQRLHAYKRAAKPGRQLFVPFRDATSGKETYGAARYLDLDDDDTGWYELDFNKAYNPYCAYNDRYECPLAPRENWLSVAIRAGELSFPRGQVSSS